MEGGAGKLGKSDVDLVEVSPETPSPLPSPSSWGGCDAQKRLAVLDFRLTDSDGQHMLKVRQVDPWKKEGREDKDPLILPKNGDVSIKQVRPTFISRLRDGPSNAPCLASYARVL